MTDPSSARVNDLADRFWEAVLELNPTTATLYGDTSVKDGMSGGHGTMNDQTRPRPDVRSHLTSVERQYGHIGRGGMRHLPHALHACTNNSPRAHPNQNSLAVGSSRSGNNHRASITRPG